MTTTQITLTQAAVTAILTVLPLLIAAYLRLVEVLRPLLQRRRLRIAILAAESVDAPARAFLASLRRAGYVEATITRSALSCLGQQAVILWQPDPDEAERLAGEVRDTAPEATLLVLTHGRLPQHLVAQVLLSNSALRLRSDVAAVAEAT